MKYNLKALEYTCKGSKMRHQENFCLGFFQALQLLKLLVRNF